MDINNSCSQANEAIVKGDYQQAIEIYQECLNQQPDNPNLYWQLGLSYLLANQEEVAEEIWFNGLMQETTEEEILSKELQQVLSQAIIQFLNSQDDEKAKIIYLKLLELNEQGIDEKLLLGNNYRLYQYSLLNYKIGKLEVALKYLQKTTNIDDYLPEIYKLKGQILSDLQQFTEAIQAFTNYLSFNQNNDYNTYRILGDLYIAIGNIEEAKQAYQKAWNLNPEESCGAIYAFSKMYKYNTIEDDIFLSLLQIENNNQNLSDLNKSLLYYALSKAYSDLKQDEKSFIYLIKANQLQRLYVDFDEKSQEKLYQAFINYFSKEFLEKQLSISIRKDLLKPIFIIGMPRTGSTLVEQILSSHPDVYGTGENNLLWNVMKDNVNTNHQLSYEEIIRQLQNESNLVISANNYLDKIANMIPANYQYFTDKTLGNFFWIGLINIMFPNSYILHCIRNPIDTCVSCFQYAFTQTIWSYDLGEIGREYNRYSSLMEHWHNLLPGRILDLKYEDMITNFEENVRRIISYCNLSWSDNCLKFYENQRLVETTSNYQVRQPIYKTSMNKWKRYEKYLQPLLDAIDSKYLL